MNAKQLIFILGIFGFSTMTLAGYSDYYDSAKVIHVEPIKQVVHKSVPEQECWEVPAGFSRSYQQQDNSPYQAAGVVGGGLLGGVLGNQFGHGDGNVIMTVAGSILGATIAYGITEDNHYEHQAYDSYHEPKRRCRTVYRSYPREETTGYRVTYHYQGKEFVTTTATHPGKRLKVRVNVTPSY